MSFEIGDQRTEIGDRRLEIGDWRLEIGIIICILKFILIEL
jgi:hypothetical protein